MPVMPQSADFMDLTHYVYATFTPDEGGVDVVEV